MPNDASINSQNMADIAEGVKEPIDLISTKAQGSLLPANVMGIPVSNRVIT